MTNEEQIKALAELDGWKFIRIKKGPYNSGGYRLQLNGAEKGGFDDHQKFESVCRIFRIPNYLTSYDAIIPLIQRQARSIKAFVERECFNRINSTCLFDSSPTQLCEALLRATGKWVE